MGSILCGEVVTASVRERKAAAEHMQTIEY
jgi:hypothetical protein